jgi:hypothetical protein
MRRAHCTVIVSWHHYSAAAASSYCRPGLQLHPMLASPSQPAAQHLTMYTAQRCAAAASGTCALPEQQQHHLNHCRLSARPAHRHSHVNHRAAASLHGGGGCGGDSSSNGDHGGRLPRCSADHTDPEAEASADDDTGGFSQVRHACLRYLSSLIFMVAGWLGQRACPPHHALQGGLIDGDVRPAAPAASVGADSQQAAATAQPNDSEAKRCLQCKRTYELRLFARVESSPDARSPLCHACNADVLASKPLSR